MKVHDLIAWLQRQPDNAEVIISDDSGVFFRLREEQLARIPKSMPPGIESAWDSELVESREAPSVAIQ